MAAISAAAVAKAAAAVLKSKKGRKLIGKVLAVVFSPLALLIVLICALLSGGADHNVAALDLCYYGGTLPASVPDEYRQHIEDMRISFAYIDSSTASISALTENGNGLDSHRVKAIFYSLYFGSENPSAVSISRFVDCFVTYQPRSQIVTEADGSQSERTYMVAVPIASLGSVYSKIEMVMGVEITEADRKNVDEVYARTRSGGDTFSGGYELGSGTSIDLDVSAFENPAQKNNRDLVTYAHHAWESRWGYVWGTFGDVLTPSLFAYKLEQYPDGVGKYSDFIQSNWVGGRTADCVGLIKGYGWLNPDTMIINYGTNGMVDTTADGMYNAATVKGAISTIPDTPGLAVWHTGHIGIYIGNGEVIESMGTKYGVVKTKLADRNWTNWLEIPYITYLD